MAIEGIVENGQIRLRDAVHLADHTRVYVIVADLSDRPAAAIRSPRLANPQDAGDFRKHIVEMSPDAEL
jgi:hypothetical protein